MPDTKLLLSLALIPCSAIPAQARPFGYGCDAHLSTTPGMSTSVPTVRGTPFDLEIDAGSPNAPFLLIFGLSDTSWAGSPLPLDLRVLGFPGCFLNVSVINVVGLASGASGRLTIPIQTTRIATGARMFSQVAVPEVGGSRLATSRGYELTLQGPVTPFTIAVLPDTQHYVINPANAAQFEAQTDWITRNLTARELVFVSHVGDMVLYGAQSANNNQAQWDRANAAMSKLDGNLAQNPDGLIPYSTAIGNRDYDVIHAKGAATQFTAHFGSSRYAGRSYFRGAGPDGLSTYQVFDAGGREYLHLALEWRARDQVITWARRILMANPELPALITTHQYLAPVNGYDNSGDTKETGGDNGGASIFHKLVDISPQVFLVTCGHIPGGNHRSDPTSAGRVVHQILVDYSFDPNGGNGWMNLLECQPDNARIVNSCFSPTYQVGVTSGFNRSQHPSNNSVFEHDFHAHRRSLETTRTIHFTGGVDYGHGTYSNAVDTHVSSAAPQTAFGTDPDIRMSRQSGTDEQQGLIRFGDLFGTGAGQVPTDRRILRTYLTLTTEGTTAHSTADSKLYRLLVPFDDTSTWDSLNGGIQPGADTLPTPDVSTNGTVSTRGTRSFDVTSGLQAWQAGATNHGWAILNPDSDDWTFRSQDWATSAERPTLTVIFER